MEIKFYDLKPKGKLTKRKTTSGVMLHCSATPEGKSFTVDDIDRWHKEKGWTCVGYNWVIDLQGNIWSARGDDYVGSHCSGQNSIMTSVCYIGGVDTKGNAKDTRTPEQKEAMYELIDYICEKHHLGINDIYTHSQFSSKQCPSFSRTKFVSEYLAWLNKKHAK